MVNGNSAWKFTVTERMLDEDTTVPTSSRVSALAWLSFTGGGRDTELRLALVGTGGGMILCIRTATVKKMQNTAISYLQTALV